MRLAGGSAGGGLVSTLKIGHSRTGITQEKLVNMIATVREAEENNYMIRHYTTCVDGNSLYIEDIEVCERYDETEKTCAKKMIYGKKKNHNGT